MRHLFTIICLSVICLSACVDMRPSETAQPVGLLTADNGKADGVAYSVKDYFMNTADLDLSDLVTQTVNMGHKKLNMLLSTVPYTSIELHPTELFTNLGGEVLGLSSSSLNELVGDLSHVYGSDAITTEINQVRAHYLATSANTLYAESEFSVALNGDFSFSTELGEGEATVGFLPSGSLAARLVTVHGDQEINALPAQPLFVVHQRRGFVLPTSIDEISKMAPGESLTLMGRGQVGFNLGANLPVYSFEPVSHLMLNARFHLGGRVLTEGQLDIHLVRGQGDEVIVEVGISEIRSREVRVGLKSGYGLIDIPSLLEVDVGGHVWSLGELAEDLIERKLDRSGLMSYGAKALSEHTRSHITLERFRLSLDHRDHDLDQAVLQALTGDLRLMQALADRDAGVLQEVSFERNMNERRRYRGSNITSMRLFSKRSSLEGSIRIEDEDGAQDLLFEDLRRSRGTLFRDWEFRRLIMTSARWRGPQYLGAQANLRLAVTESDHFTARDQILDHVDTALLSLIDFHTAYDQLTRLYEELQHKVDIHCEYCDELDCQVEYHYCMESVLPDEEVEAWRSELERQTQRVVSEISTAADDPQLASSRQYTEALLALKLHLSSVKEGGVAFADVAGKTELLSDVRFGQAGLDTLFREITPDDFEERLREILVVIVSKRSRDYERKFDQAMSWIDGASNKIKDIVDLYAAARARYLRLDDQSRISIAGERVGNGAYRIEPLSDQDQTPVVRSIAESKVKIVAEMIDQMVERGQRISLIQSLLSIFSLGLIDPRPFESHHLVAYTLTSLVDPSSREWLLSMNFEEEVLPDLQLFSRGSDTDSFIQAGQFELEFLLE